MTKMTELKNKVEKIFNSNFYADDYDPEGEPYEYAQKVLSEYSWDDVFLCSVDYFKKHSSSLKQVLNFIELYTCNGFIDRPIAKPYEFAALVASKVDFAADWDKGADRVDDFLVFMLDSMGVISLYMDPYYQLKNDQKFLTALTAIKKQSS